MDTAERLEQLKKAREAAAAVRDEINRRNDSDPRPSNVLKRAPILRRASNELTDLDLLINDLESAAAPVALDESLLADLDRLSARLDSAIATDALIGLGLDSVLKVLDSVQELRETLA